MKKFLLSVIVISILTGLAIFNNISGTNFEPPKPDIGKEKVNILYEKISKIKQSVNLQKVDIFSQDFDKKNSVSVEKYVKNAQMLVLKKDKLAEILLSRPHNITFIIPGLNNKEIELELTISEIFSPEFRLRSIDAEGVKTNEVYNQGLHFQGIIKDKEKSIASLSIFDKEVVCMFSDETGNYVLGSNKTLKSDVSYVLYNDANLLIPSPFKCPVGNIADKFYKTGLKTEPKILNNNKNATLPVKVHFEADFDMYTDAGSSVTNVGNFIASFFNALVTIYTNESIPFQIAGVDVWTSIDPYSSLNDSYPILTMFGGRAKDDFEGNFAHLLSTGHSQQLGGIAWIGVLCQPFNTTDSSGRYGFSNIEYSYNGFPTWSWTVNCVTHELGHNLGSMHTHACWWPVNGHIGAIDSCYTAEGGFCFGGSHASIGTIMSYCHLWNSSGGGVNFNLGFGYLPGDTIRLRYNQAGCMQRTINSSELPITYNLLQNYPNPFNPVTNIKYALPEDSYITIKVFDITGKEITTLIYDSFRPAGIYTVMFDAGKYNLTSGIYFYRIIAVSTISNKTYTDIKKMIFTK